MSIYYTMNKIITKIKDSEKESCSKEDLDQMKLMAKQIIRRKGKRSNCLRKSVAAAMVIVLAGGLTIGVGASNGLGRKLTTFFNGTISGKKITENIDHIAGSDQIVAEDRDENITVKVVQSVSVKGMLYVLLKVELPYNQTFKKDHLIKNFWIRTGAEDDTKKIETYAMGQDQVELVQREKNIGWFVCQAERKGYDFHNKEITIQLKGFTNTHTTPAHLIFENPKGSWDVQWMQKENKSDVKTVIVKKNYIFKDTKDELLENPRPIKIQSLEITPFHMKVYYGEKGSKKMETISGKLAMKFKDGTIQKEEWAYGSEDPLEKEYRYEHVNFMKVIDLQQLESVIIGENEIPIR